jgi:hypothetical protein
MVHSPCGYCPVTAEKNKSGKPVLLVSFFFYIRAVDGCQFIKSSWNYNAIGLQSITGRPLMGKTASLLLTGEKGIYIYD